MKNIASSEQGEAEKHLLRIGPNGFEIDTDVSAKFLKDFAKIDTGGVG